MGGPMMRLATGVRQPPGLRAMPRTWKPKPTRPSTSDTAETQRNTVFAARWLTAPHTPATAMAPLRITGDHMIFCP